MKRADVLVLFGATGDLAKKKLFPALYEMQEAGELEIPVFAVASSKWTQDEFKLRVESSIRDRKESLGEFVNESILKSLLDEMNLVVGDYEDPATFDKLKVALADFELPVVYLAIAPAYFTSVTQGLNSVGLTKSARVVVEKPFGRDLESASALDESLKKLLPEDQIYRIDHYLGKESVEDLLVFRFANTLFEPVWNRNYISNIQITMTEDFGVEGRGKFYDEVGATRDVLQNHLLQVLTMLTMEPPIDMGAHAMQDEKFKVLSAVREIEQSDVVRGQFVGYLDEAGVAEHSDTETFVAMKLFIDNWRWAGVPIYIRTGKKMAETTMEAVVEFKQPPRQLFTTKGSPAPEPNIVRFRMGRQDGVDLSLQAKSPGSALITNTVDLTVEFAAALGDRKEAYERLLDAAILGDHFRFTRIDAVLQSWKVLDDVLKNPTKLHPYFEDTWGPSEALDMVPGGWAICGKAADKSPHN
jgi:glucose-6-phosphate 1-dehydrogenase